MPNPKPSQPERKPSAASSQPPASAASRQTKRPTDSVPIATGTFAKLPMRFGRYQVEKLLGKGAMGAVYLARDTQLERLVALKIPKLSGSGAAKLLQRLKTEAKAAAQIDHPNVCHVYDSGEIDGTSYIAMQYVEGETLKEHLEKQSPSPPEAVELVLALAQGLLEAHSQGIYHRDLKPENIKLNRRGVPVIMDFGLAKLTATVLADAGNTQSGTILGSPAYMSPEQAGGKVEEIDHRSDLYALGVILYEMLTGQWPFTGRAMQVMGQKSILDPPSPLTVKPELNPQLAAVCHKLLAKKQEDRYQDAKELIASLKAIDPNSPAALSMNSESRSVEQPPADQDGPSFDFLKSLLEAPAPGIRSTPENTCKKSQRGTPGYSALVPLVNWWHGQPPAMRWSILGSAGVCGAFLAAVLFFRNGDALVKVEIHAKNVEVTFQKETLTLSDGAKQFRVKPGSQTLHITSGNVEFDTDKFTLKRGENPAVTVELVKSEIVTKLGDREIGRRSLSARSTNRANANRETVDMAKTGWHGWPADAPPPAIAPFDAATAKKHQAAWAKYLKLPVEYINDLGMKFRLIPSGKFTMGSPPSEEGRQDNENQTEVTLTKGFWLGKYEVTQGEWERVMASTPWKGENDVKDSANYAASFVTWDSAVDFCRALTAQETKSGRLPDGWEYTLPTEAQWEYACRAGSQTRYTFGDIEDELGNYAWFGGNAKEIGEQYAHEVGMKKANAWGLHDMHGNVCEWCLDVYGEKLPGGTDPEVTFGGSDRVFRGGGWIHVNAGNCRSASRFWFSPGFRYPGQGFRIARCSVK